MPKVSVIIPFFNATPHLRKCVESCIKQTLTEIEIILVDDKSADNSLQVARSLAHSDGRIRLVSHSQNLGTFLARKSGVDCAKGEFLFFLDADDFLSVNALEILYKNAVENGADMVHCDILPLPFKRLSSKPKIQMQILQNDEILRQIFICDFRCGYLVVCGKLLSANLVRHALNKLSFINCHLVASEDSALFLPLCALAKKSVGAVDAKYFYTQNPHSLLKSKDKKKILIQIENRTFLKENLPILRKDGELGRNRHFEKSLQNTLNLMDYFICYNARFLPRTGEKNGKNFAISPYIKYSILSFKFVPRWQIAVKLAIFLLTFGRKKL